ncbi:HD domain-containing phosphohydrolase [Imhoffiella purpurea]|uniref:Diguanylate cyclase n=1 Tax=Imhoffiella purpurea TaxID=1249627 RepID=W9VH40_9GAMM|nr:HD domain-containing phosphohydrolase [Imhoffiella purpurea]EXJ16311.1 diguanylate cyclase [Imhoffiella purpurea]
MKQRIYAAAALVATLLIAFQGILMFAASERERDVQNLQARMNILVDSRAEAVSAWLRSQFEVLGGLADNASLQVYVSVIANSGGDRSERDYLRNLLIAKAEQFGFAPERLTTDLPANTKPLGTGGLALLDPDGGTIASTIGMPPIEGRLASFLSETPPTERGFWDLHQGKTTNPILGLVVPVYEQTGTSKAEVIARVAGLRQVDARFFEALEQPGSTAKTAESYLIRRAGNQVQYLTPLRDGSRPLSKSLAVNSEGLIDVAALSGPGRFHEGLDYGAVDCFAVSRKIPGTPWVLVHKIAQEEALAQTNARQTSLIVALTAVLLLFGAGLLVAWRYSTSHQAEEAARRAEESARRHQESAERFESLWQFLNTVTDAQPHPIFVTDAANGVTFCNRRMAEICGVDQDEIRGDLLHEDRSGAPKAHSLIGLLGHDIGGRLNAIDQEVLNTGRSTHKISHFVDENGREQIWHSYHCPLEAAEGTPTKILTTIQDLTDLMRERARRERNTWQLIDTLVGLVDERDPDAAHQSSDTALIARHIAEGMGLEATLVDTADQAARLANIGKIRIPRALLTKKGEFDEEERAIVRQALDEGPNLLEDIEFDGPVVETLRQINERPDGEGRPHGLSGDEIIPTAKAVAVANCFVALQSPRAFREPKSLDEVEGMLMEEIGRRFDKRAVLSLLNYLNNQGGRETWMAMTRRA